MAQLWTNKEEEFLRVNIESMTRPAIAKALQRSEVSIQNKAQKLGLLNIETFRKAKRMFDEDQEKQIIKSYLEGETVQNLAKIWG